MYGVDKPRARLTRRVPVKTRMELACIAIHRARKRGFEPDAAHIASQYLLSEETAKKLLVITPGAEQSLIVPDLTGICGKLNGSAAVAKADRDAEE